MDGFGYFRRQQGAVLVVALIMLLLVTLMATSAYKISQGNQMVIGNMESREQSMIFAEAAIEEAISSTLFVSSPGNLFLSSCGEANRKCYDMNGDGVDEVFVRVEPPGCIVVTPKSNEEVLEMAEDLINAAELETDPDRKDWMIDQAFKFTSCQSASSAPVRPGLSLSNTVDSQCSVAAWDFVAVAEDSITGARATVRQGISVWAARNNIESVCPAASAGSTGPGEDGGA